MCVLTIYNNPAQKLLLKMCYLAKTILYLSYVNTLKINI